MSGGTHRTGLIWKEQASSWTDHQNKNPWCGGIFIITRQVEDPEDPCVMKCKYLYRG